MKRTLEHQEKILAQKSKLTMGYVNKSMFDGLEFEDCVSDTLHLFLRITDLLFDLFIAALSVADQAGENVFYNPNNHPHFRTFISFLQTECRIGIKTHSSTIKQINQFLNRLTGHQRNTILEKQNFEKLFGSVVDFEVKLENVDSIGGIWRSLYDIMLELRKNNRPSGATVEKHCQEWLEKFLAIYKRKNCTPSVHIFVNHLHQMYGLHQEANFFNMQGLEKSNHVVKMVYQRSTNKRDKPLRQALQKLCRLDYLRTILNLEDTF